jgi:hypothetical protein
MQVGTLRDRVNTIADELTILERGISESYDGYARKQVGKEDTSVEKEITELKTQQRTYDRKFQEKEAAFQMVGGKTRKQTLQEYTLLLFFVSYLVFALSLAIWKSAKGGSPKEGAQIFGILLLALVPIAGLMYKFL